ncbi:MAG: hypothetical protein ACRDYA_01510 [Egibacteraceae bacterium]
MDVRTVTAALAGAARATADWTGRVGGRRGWAPRKRAVGVSAGRRCTGRPVASDGADLDRRQLRGRVDEWTHTVDPDALAGREKRAWANRGLSVSTDSPRASCGEASSWTRSAARR